MGRTPFDTGLSRAPVQITADEGADQLYMLEVNTQPGMTATPLTPEQAALSASQAKSW